MGATRLTKIQMGLEDTKGSAEAATNLWVGNGVLTDDTTHINRDDNVGIVVDIDSEYIAALDATIALSERPASFEQLPYLNEMSMPTATPTSNGSTTTAYIRAYTPDVDGELSTNATYTFEVGDSTQAYEVEYCAVKDFKLSGAEKQAVRMSANLFGRQVTKTTFTSPITIPTEEAILFEKGILSFDTTTIGTTPYTHWLDFDLTYVSGLNPFHSGSGNLYFSSEIFSKPELSGSFSFWHDSQGVGLYDLWVAKTGQKLRMNFPGTSVGTGGTHLTKLYRIDAFAKFNKVSLLDQSEGQNLVKVDWAARYNATAALWAQFTNVNTLATLT